MTGNILIVDDDLSVLKSVARLLSAHGYSITVATDGSQALQKALEETPDVILMDVHMPIMNGVDAARAIKSHPQLQRTVIIAITALPSDRERDEPSFACVLMKPCPASDLIAAIERVRR
jgi:CheY-like chemotaxis protein